VSKEPYIYDTHEACARYRTFDAANDDWIYGTRYATMGKIRRIRAEEVGPRIFVEKKYLEDGWTKKGFDPDNPA